MIPESAIPNILTHMRRREALFRVKTTAMLVCGIPLSFVGPLLLATVFWFVAWRFGYHGVRWSWFFWGAVVVVIPLLYRLELRTRGDYLGTVATGPGVAAPSGWMIHHWCPNDGHRHL